MQIAFPKSSEDHRLQLIEINGSIIAIVHSPLESLGPIQLNCEEWSLVILAPIKSKSDILISAINVICLNQIASEEGSLKISASNQFVKFAHLINSSDQIEEVGSCGKIEFEDDPGAFLHYHRLFEGIVSCSRRGDPDSLFEAQQKLIMSLCTLADKIQGKPGNLNLQEVLGFWQIPSLVSEV